MPRRALLVLLFLACAAQAAGPLKFDVTYAPAVCPGPFTGRVFVLLSRPAVTEPPSLNWFRPEPFFAVDVKNWRPGEALVVDGDALGFPTPLARLPNDTYSAIALMDFDRGERDFARAPGNAFGKPVRLALNPAATGAVRLHIDQTVPPRSFRETERVKLVEVPSRLLSAFHGRPVSLRAAVVLPKSFAAEPARRYPVVYEIPGFSGTHALAFGAERRNATEVAGVEVLHVALDPSIRTGHHVFADSDNNGPCGRALLEELIPEVERRFRALGTPASRLLTGHSSGGWSSLWLQVTYPDFFNGTWSTAPDPVDFRDFQRINLYRPGENFFNDAEGKARPIARREGKTVLWYKPFSDMEEVMGHGGQLASFEAVFSPRGADGRPRRLWDRRTGALDTEVVRAWERYDIRLVLERGWPTLGPKLAGKLHVYMGAEDTFYLEGATRLLKESLARLGSDAVVELFPERHHGNLIDRALRERINREMAARLRR